MKDAKKSKCSAEEYPYYVIAAISFEGGVGSRPVYRKEPVETRSQFNDLYAWIEETNPNHRNIFITNIMTFKNE